VKAPDNLPLDYTLTVKPPNDNLAIIRLVSIIK